MSQTTVALFLGLIIGFSIAYTLLRGNGQIGVDWIPLSTSGSRKLDLSRYKKFVEDQPQPHQLDFSGLIEVLERQGIMLTPSIPQELKVVADLSADGLTYSDEAFFGSDVFFPEIKEIERRAKFLPASSEIEIGHALDPRQKESVQLGYEITVIVESLDTSTIPEKYRSVTHIRILGIEAEIPPLEQVVYEMRFDFALRDTDGFILSKLSSAPDTVTSGKDNRFLSIVENLIPRPIAERTASIEFSMNLRKCNSCTLWRE
ncbi:hypothetical protein MYX65_05580 [Acidobacteria bacterium AH-259-L09]|nr:hypothetical protein [Acidobacteria bacterium AH-259-L09]